jgi:hypothetical protein
VSHTSSRPKAVAALTKAIGCLASLDVYSDLLE